MSQSRSFFLFALLVSLLSIAAGCSCASPSPGTDAASPDAAPIDTGVVDSATIDAAHDVGIDAMAPDTLMPPDAPMPPVCDRPGYPVSSEATRDERTAVETAAAAFTTDTGVSVDLDPTTAAVTGFSAPFPVTLDPSITDPCARALAAVQAFLTDHAALMRVPPDIAMRACSYDSLLDMEVVRLHGGTYGGRRILGQDNDLVVHVTRSGTIRFWAGSYLPVAERLLPSPCFNPSVIESSLVGMPIHYLHFAACVPGSTGMITLQAGDTRTAGESALYVDATGLVHVARQVEVLLAASHVTSSEISSDLYCCSGTSLDGCVGTFVIVDEITLDALQQIPRCITC